MSSVLIVMLCGLFGLMLLGLPLGFTIVFVSSIVLVSFTDLPLWMFIQRFFAGLDSFVLVAIPFFLLAGNIMNKGNITDKLIDFSYALVGHIKGGLALVNVLVSMLFGGISGSAVADVSGVGTVIIPAMIKKGYSKSFSVAITATSSTLGQIIPPSIIMIIYAASSGSSVGALFLAGAIPGLLIGLGLMLVSYIYAVKYKYPSEKKRSFKEILSATKEALYTLGAPIIIIGGVVFGIFTATEASVIAVVYCLIITMFIYKTITWRDIPEILLDTAKMSAVTLFCIGGASMFGWLMGYFRINEAATVLISSVTGSGVGFLLIVVALFLLVGTFMDAAPAIIIFVPVIVPIANSLGINSVHLGIVICTTLAFGLITPPYGLCLLLASSIAGIPAHRTFRDLAICLGVVVLVLLIITFMPDIILFLPRLIVPEFI